MTKAGRFARPFSLYHHRDVDKHSDTEVLSVWGAAVRGVSSLCTFFALQLTQGEDVSDQRMILISSGEDFDAIKRLEESFQNHLAGIGTVEFIRLGDTSSLIAAYSNTVNLVRDPEAWYLFVHQDVRPVFPSARAGVSAPSETDEYPWLRVAFERPGLWMDAARKLLARSDTGFLGVAGSCSLSVGSAWWNESRLSGAMLHESEGGSVRMNAYGPWGRVAVLDGAFLMATGAVFDTMGTPRPSPDRFHFYDMELSLMAHNAGLKNWTLPLLLIHGSGGASHSDKGWQDDLEPFLTRYRSLLPVEVPFEPLPEVE
jgi:hypothetical protein